MNIDDKQPIEPAPTTTVSPGVPQPTKDASRIRNWARKHKVIAAIVMLGGLIVIAGAAYFVVSSIRQNNQFSLTIGETTITQTDLDRYKQGLSQYKQQNPDARIEGSPEELALNAVVMNAALKKEAKQYNKSLNNDEIRQLYDLPESQNPETYYKQISSNQSASDNSLGYYLGITKENQLLQRKLYDNLIGKRSLTYASVSFDAPYFREQFNNPEALAKLHQEAQQRLNKELLPLFKSGASKEEIGKKADVNYIADPKFSNPDIFFNKVATTAAYMPNYNDTLNSVTATNSMPPSLNTNLNDVAESFKDLNDVNYGMTVPDLRNTADEINTLQNVGESTGVFASKTGAYMIVRLEGKQGGQYQNWQAFTDAYKPKQKHTSMIQLLQNKALGLTAAAIKLVPITRASAEANCSAHTVTMSVTMLDVDTQSVVAGNVSLTQGGTCGAGFRSSNTGTLSFVGNCYAPEPTVNYQIPAGYTFSGYQSSDWNPQNVNQLGYWQAFIYVKRDTRKIMGSSSMVPDDGQPSFGTNPSSFSHTITHGSYYPYVSSDFGVSGSWNVPLGQNAYAVTAEAPGGFTDSKGSWTLVGSTTKTRDATASNGWNATIQFRYRLSGGGTGDSPTCSLSVTPSSLPTGGGTVTVSWSSTKNKSGSISPTIGALGDAGSSNSRFGGSQDVSVSAATTFTGVWIAEDGKQVQCSDGVTVGSTPPPPPPTAALYKPYIRVYGNDVMVGSTFKDDFNECTGYNYDAKIQAYIGSDATYQTGSSGQFAVFNYATQASSTPWKGGIDGFFSNNTNARYDPGKHNSNDLVFGNHYSRGTPDPRGGDGYNYVVSERVPMGGDSGILHCNPNFFKDFKDKGATVVGGGTLSSIDPSISAPIQNGARKSLVVDGNLFIDTDIKYANTSWSSVGDIPNVSIIVRGNISIGKNVGRIDGLLIAQPKCLATLSQGQQCPANQLSGGEVYSCGTASGSVDDTAAQTECNKQLVINGTVIARSARWYRSNGTVACPTPSPLACQPATPNEPASSGSIAEVINFSPELYLAPLNRQQNNSGPLQKYDSITSLPPVL